MSGTLPPRSPQPPPAADDDATLSGGISRGLRPWQIIVIIVGAVLVLSFFMDFKDRFGGKKHDDSGATLASGVGSGGEAWKSPVFPAPVEPVVARQPIPLVQDVVPPAMPGKGNAIADIRMAGNPTPPPQAAPQQAGGAHQDPYAGKTAVAYKAAVLPGAKAGIIKDPARTLMPGMIPCTLVNAIDSSHAGPLQCIIPVTVFSRLGVPLMKRGTEVMGGYTVATQGNHRIMAVTAEATTPDIPPIVVPLGGPISDELGRTGAEGNLNNHWVERFGPAVLLTLLNGGINAGTAYLQNNRGNNTNSPSSSTYLNFGQNNSVESLAQEALRNSINIPPTIEIPQGTTIGLWVLNHIDFSDAIELRVTR